VLCVILSFWRLLVYFWFDIPFVAGKKGRSCYTGGREGEFIATLNLPQSQIVWIGLVQIFLIFFVGIFFGCSADADYVQHTALLGLTLLFSQA